MKNNPDEDERIGNNEIQKATGDRLSVPREHGSHETVKPRSIHDPLLLVILGTAIGLTVLVVGFAVFWGSGPVIAEIPWSIPMVAAFVSLASLCVAFLAFGRYQVLGDPVSYWVGIGFASLGIGQLFYVLTWPGLLPEGGAIIARLPNTPAIITALNLTIFSGFMLAAVLIRWPRKQTLLRRRWLGVAAAWLIFFILIFILIVSFEQYMPVLVRTDGTFTPEQQGWVAFLLLLFASGSSLSTRHYLRSRDALAGYVAFAQMALVFILMMAIIGEKRYDLWWYLQRAIGVGGYLIVLFGLLSEYVRLLRRESEGRLMLEAVMENAPVGLAITGGPPGFPLAKVSRHGLEMNQRPIEGLIGATSGQHQAAWRIFLPDGITQPLPEQMPLYRASRLGEKIRNMEMVMEAQDGRKIPVLVNAAPIRDAQGKIVAAINTWLDITEIKEAEAELRKSSEALKERNERLWESEQRYRGLFEAMQEGLVVAEVITDEMDNPVDYRYLDVNPVTERQYGLSRDQFIGRTYTEVLPGYDPEWITILGKVALTGEPVSLEKYGIVTGLWFQCRAYSPRPGQVVNIFTDITERKRAEAALLKHTLELEHANRDLQNFTVLTSHDLQEPLRKIEALGDTVLNGASNLDEHVLDRIQRMRKSAQQMRKMVDALLQLSLLSTDTQSFQPVDLRQITLDILAEKEEQIQQSGGVVEVSDLPVIEADPLQLRRLFQHLIENALKFQPPGGKPRIKISSKQLASGSVQILIDDNGIGFDEAHAGQLFEPFEQLVGKNQPQYDGIGMGLAICRWIVERHGGEIATRSKPGQGTTFIVALPIYQ